VCRVFVIVIFVVLYRDAGDVAGVKVRDAEANATKSVLVARVKAGERFVDLGIKHNKTADNSLTSPLTVTNHLVENRRSACYCRLSLLLSFWCLHT